MKKSLLTFLLLFFVIAVFSQTDKIAVVKKDNGVVLEVNGNGFMINGVNWDYFPIGTNFNYSLWKQSDDLIKAALDAEMSLLKNMGGNSIRAYVGMQPKWIQYIYEEYGIYTIINHSFGRYGLTIDGTWVANTEYADPRTRALLLKEVSEMVEEYKGTPGLLMYLLGNENNYGLFWEGAETEDIPVEDRKSTERARAMYKLFNEAVVEMKKLDDSRPMSICNGDLLFLDIIAEECKDIDVLGINCYRGASFGDLFEKVKESMDVPVMFAEFGADAFNEINMAEDQRSQAIYNLANWKEIYENAAGLGKSGNSIGGYTFQYSDGWWKYGQTKNLEIHDVNASWGNGGYKFDYVPGENNMNEEWFGICAKGETNERGLYELYPRAAYYALKEAHKLNPYSPETSLESIDNYFSNINVEDAILQARGDRADLISQNLKKAQVGLRGEITTYSTGGYLITTPKNKTSDYDGNPSSQGFDHTESFYVDIDAQPAENIHTNVSFNILGNVAENPIEEIFYENRGQSKIIYTDQGTSIDISSAERIKLYQADFDWKGKWFNLTGFYRTGHYHWGYEGDFFGLYPETNYGPNIDIYNGNAPFGFEVEAKKDLSGLKIAFGPELWWGANPSLLVKYSRKVGKYTLTGIYQEDLDQRESTVSSYAIPRPQDRRATLGVERKFGSFGFQLGGIWAGQPLNGEIYQIVEGESGAYTVYQNEISSEDNWGGKAKVTLMRGPLSWYAQGAVMGLVANGGADYTKTFTGWTLKDSGSGNQYNFLTGFAYLLGNLQIAPNFMWQKPIVGPVPGDVQAPGRPRNILDDPFAVRVNRETVAAELLIAFDPTPATWMYEWDNDMQEDAPFAASVDFVYRHHPTTQDAGIGVMANRTLFAFPGAPEAHDLWEVNTRIVSKVSHDFGLIAKILLGNAQSNGSDERIIERYTGDLTMIYKKVKFMSSVKINDWGPYDYYRDFNLTYPLQLVADFSTRSGKANWFNLPDTRVGIRCLWRSLDQYSPRYAPTYRMNTIGELEPDPTALGYDNGNEWEIRAYLHFKIGK
jgi:hypothetical protein